MRAADRDTQLLAFADALGVGSYGLLAVQLRAVLAGELDRRAQPFLWVVDELRPGLGAETLATWRAPGRYGRTLMTTRSREYSAIGTQLELGVLSAHEGYDLLLEHQAPEDLDEQAAARGLVEDLGGHALAIDVTGAALRAARGTLVCAVPRSSQGPGP